MIRKKNLAINKFDMSLNTSELLKSTSHDIIDELSKHVTARSKSGIIACLTNIKNDSKIYDNFIKGKRGLDLLIKLLKYQNHRVLDITLSILANAFLKSSIREEVRETVISGNVVWIIKNLPPGVTLHCRACRLISNMAESERHAKALCDVGVIAELNGVINTESNSQTLLMAIRAIRNIWTTIEESRAEILELKLIKTIAGLLVLYKSKYQDNIGMTKYKDLTEVCLKALRAFAHVLHPLVGEQIKGKDLCGFKCIAEFCKSNNRISFQLLYNLCRVADHRPNLGCCGLIECLISFLKLKRLSNSSLASFIPEVVGSLCLFSREAVNRLKIRNSGGLELMLNLLKDVKNDSYHPILLHALTQFVGDEHGISIMIKNGIVNVLVTRLQRMVLDVRLESTIGPNDNTNNSNNKSVTRKRTADSVTTQLSRNSSITSEIIKCCRTNNGRFSLDFCSSQLSPCSINSSTSSPSNSPPLMLYANSDAVDEDDNYSPVCSDSEDWVDNEENTATQEEIDSLASYASTNIARDDGSNNVDVGKNLETDLITDMSEVNLAHMWTLILLTKLTFWNDPIEGLADSSTIQALMAYIVTSKNDRGLWILNRIIKNHVYFLPLLLQGFVFEAQLLDNSQDYLQIMCSVAESGGAFGDLATVLIRGQDSDKYIVALSVPFLLKCKSKLRMLLNNYGGLDLIFIVLADQEHLLNKNAILSICQLADVLGIITNTVEKRPLLDNHIDDNYKQNKIDHQMDKLKSKNIVTFELDDGDTVDVSRHLLCIKSQVFSAMLEGKFFESDKKRVRLPNVPKDGFTTLCLAASGSFFDDPDRNIDKIEIEELLDAVLLADKFLMFDELDKLTEISMSRLSHDNLNRAWNWARRNDCRELKIYCAKNFLTVKISVEERLKTFRDFHLDQNFDEFLQDVKGIVMGELLIRD